jgi:purine-nucleoside phosphorylase
VKLAAPSRHVAEGVKAVEMETAAFFAVGERLNVPAAAVFVIGDRLIDRTWQPVDDTRLLRRRVSTIMEALVETLSVE